MMQHFRATILFTVVASSMALSANADSSSALTVDVDGFRNRQGQVCLSVFATSKGFPSKTTNALRQQCLKITNTPARVTFGQLPPGSYAVSVLHDQNNDRKPNSNFLGIPKEGFGFSRNPVIRFGPPKFAASEVPVVGSSTNIQIRLKYF